LNKKIFQLGVLYMLWLLWRGERPVLSRNLIFIAQKQIHAKC
jgi:hypothetical protein